VVGDAGCGGESEEEDGEDEDDGAGLEGAVLPAGVRESEGSGGWTGFGVGREGGGGVGGVGVRGKGEVEGVFGGADGDAAEASGALGGVDGDELGDGEVGGAGVGAFVAVDAGGLIAADFDWAQSGNQTH